MGLDIVRAGKGVWLYIQKYLREEEQVTGDIERVTFAPEQAVIRGGGASLLTDGDDAVGFFGFSK